MELQRFDFDYNEGLQWIAVYTESQIFNKDKVNITRMKREREIDISRTYYFPKSLHYKNSGNYYFAGWESSQLSCYIQGDMDGGGFLQPFWNAFAIKEKEDLATFMQLSQLRFGYVNDNNERCSVAIIYNLLDPTKYMISFLKNAETPIFENRKVTLFISEYFCKDMGLVQCLDSKNIWSHLKSLLNSSALEVALQNVFTKDGMIDVANGETFAKTQLKYWGVEKQLLEEQEKEIKKNIIPETIPETLLKIPPTIIPSAPIAKPIITTTNKRTSYYTFLQVIANITTGAAVGYLLGISIVALAITSCMLTFPIIASLIGIFLGLIIGAALFHYSSLDQSRDGGIAKEKEIPHKISHESSYSHIAKYGIQDQLLPCDKPLIKTHKKSVPFPLECTSSPIAMRIQR